MEVEINSHGTNPHGKKESCKCLLWWKCVHMYVGATVAPIGTAYVDTTRPASSCNTCVVLVSRAKSVDTLSPSVQFTGCCVN